MCMNRHGCYAGYQVWWHQLTGTVNIDLKNIDEKSRKPVWTVPNVPLGPRYSTGFHSRQKPVVTETVYCYVKRGGGGIRALLTAGVWTDFRCLQNKSTAKFTVHVFIYLVEDFTSIQIFFIKMDHVTYQIWLIMDTKYHISVNISESNRIYCIWLSWSLKFLTHFAYIIVNCISKNLYLYCGIWK